MSSAEAVPAGLADFASRVDNSWIRMLDADPETEANAPNKESREVRSGHYVLVKPDPLADPELLIHSPSLAAELGLDQADVETPGFAAFFSGQVDAIPGFQSWCTPYALSIYGSEMYRQCPFQNGNGYGDGRAISVAEVISPTTGSRWELQLKGGGTTPFCRGADGRAVLRSSIREFLASEAMHHLGVSTTRALSLIQSNSDVVMRPWYSNRGSGESEPDIDDPRLAGIPKAMRRMFLAQLADQMKQESRQPDVMTKNPAAITTRAAKSFVRVGHVELMGRRARKHASDATAQSQLQAIVKHLIFREFPDIRPAESGGSTAGEVVGGEAAGTDNEAGRWDAPLTSAEVLAVLRRVSAGIATLTADWIRVGFVQGNFNSDNCLAAGRTMDYGPFGFLEEYKPLWNMWQGSGDHFGFLNQPTAGAKNFESFVTAVLPLLRGDSAATAAAKVLVSDHEDAAAAACDDVWRRKLGFAQYGEPEEAIKGMLEGLMQLSKVDYTIFWRQLAAAAETSDDDSAAMLATLEPAWYTDLKVAGPELQAGWVKALGMWKGQLARDGRSPAVVSAAMRKVSPKYVPREWMLVDAYTAAHTGDIRLVHELHDLFMKPYEEQPEYEEKYYRKAPAAACTRGGTGFMS